MKLDSPHKKWQRNNPRLECTWEVHLHFVHCIQDVYFCHHWRKWWIIFKIYIYMKNSNIQFYLCKINNKIMIYGFENALLLKTLYLWSDTLNCNKISSFICWIHHLRGVQVMTSTRMGLIISKKYTNSRILHFCWFSRHLSLGFDLLKSYIDTNLRQICITNTADVLGRTVLCLILIGSQMWAVPGQALAQSSLVLDNLAL